MKSKITHVKIIFLLLATTLLLQSQSAIAQYCTPTFSGGCFSWSNQSIQVACINWSVSSCTTSDYTSMVADVVAGTTVPMSVTSGNWCGCAVWIDTNNNGAFEDDENFYYSYSGNMTNTYSFNLNIPANLAPGNYRMRIVAGWGSDGYGSGGSGSTGNGYGPCGGYQEGNFDDFTVQVSASCTPVINIQPQPQTVCIGQAITFTTSATNGTLTYSWQLNGQPITGATDSTYTIASAAITDTGEYAVMVSNCCSQATSDSAFLHVVSLPNDTVSPASPVSFCADSSVTISVPSQGGANYTWMSGGNAVNGATNASYTVNTAGTYSIIVAYNAGCADTSGLVIVTMNPVPTPTITYAGNILSVAGGPYTSYQWYKNDTLIAGATSATYTTTHDGHYTIVVTNASGCSGTSPIYLLGINNVLSNSNMVSVYPNPAESYVNISLDGVPTGKAFIKLTDIAGKTIRAVPLTGSTTVLDISTLPPGMYFIYYTDDIHKQMIKLAK